MQFQNWESKIVLKQTLTCNPSPDCLFLLTSVECLASHLKVSLMPTCGGGVWARDYIKVGLP